MTINEQFEDAYDIAALKLALWGSDPDWPVRIPTAMDYLRIIMELRANWHKERLPEGYCDLAARAIQLFDGDPETRVLKIALLTLDELYNRRLKRQDLADAKQHKIARTG